MTDIKMPQTIYLQVEDEGGMVEHLNDATWCAERINASDITYHLIPDDVRAAIDTLTMYRSDGEAKLLYDWLRFIGEDEDG